MPSTPPVRRLGRVRKPCASTPSPTACVPVTSSSPAKTQRMRLRALTYGLRARNLILPSEDPEEYKQLWADLEAEWQPQSRTERMHLEQMATSQWLLARFAKSERRIYVCESSVEKQLALLD